MAPSKADMVRSASAALTSASANAREAALRDPEAFMARPGKHLIPVLHAYSELFKGFEVTSRAALNELVKVEGGRDQELGEEIETLWEAEDEYDAVLLEIDGIVMGSQSSGNASVSSGSPAPLSQCLTEVSTRRTLTLQDLLEASPEAEVFHLVLLRHFA